MRLISREEVKSVASYNEWVNTIEDALRLIRDRDYTMPRRSHIDFGDNTLLLMPCIGSGYYATKLVSVFPGNSKKDLPQVSGTVILNSAATGETLAIIDGTTLTALRTAAVGSLGIRHLAPAGAGSLGIVGAGAQGTYQCLMACSQRNFKKVNVYDTNAANSTRFKEQVLTEYPQLELVECSETTELCRESEVIITATNSLKPVLPDSIEVLQGKTIIGIGSYKPEMREFPDVLYELIDNIYIDTEDGISESGDLIYPIDKGFLQTDQLIPAHKMLKAETERPTTRVFKSVGMALFDLYGAILVYESITNSKK